MFYRRFVFRRRNAAGRAGAAGRGNVGRIPAEYLGTVPRRIPEVSNGGLEKYPVYGKTLSATQEEKQAIIDENNGLCASSSTYDSMDAEGNLYLAGEPTGNVLYKHSASAGMYEGDVSDAEPAVVKRITIRPRGNGNHITGLYAPAGEVIKIEMSGQDLAATGGLKVIIGQTLTNGQSNNIWLARDFNRMPVISNTMTVDSEVGYVGSFLGGPIYVQPLKTDSVFTVTISGGVNYSHFISGYTTKEEFAQNKDSTAPYFDLEVWDDSVRHSGPKARAEQFDYDQLTEAALLWDKIACVSNQVPAGSGGDTGITFLYDPFIAAGSMVAFVGRYTVNCPLYCLTAALDAESAVNNSSDAFWGNIHEFNHHYQRFGFAPGDEVTNNAVSLVEYSLFTKNSSNRSLGNANEGTYATGWNRYTNPSWVLRQTLANRSTNSALDSYANLLHTFGQKLFIDATKNGNGSGGADAWYRAVSDATHNDMTYYFTEILHQNVSEDILAEYGKKGYPVFVPVATIFQTGRSYFKDGKKYYSDTVQPYEIETGKSFTIDLNATVVLPQGFSWKVKDIAAPAYGKLEKSGEGVYIYTPDAAHRNSGKFAVTLSIEKDDGAFTVEDVELVLAFRQKQHTEEMGEEEPFASEYFYSRDYRYDHTERRVASQSLVETNYRAWDDNYPIENLFDADETNFIHSNRADITADDPFELTVELSETVRANRFTIYGEPSRTYQPKTFKLYAGTEKDDLRLIADIESSVRTGNNVVVNFAERDIRYYKLVVTDTWAPYTKYIAYRYAEFSYAIQGGRVTSPDADMFVYRGNWSLSGALSSFGHLYVGQNATLDFEFTGSRFAIFSQAAQEYGTFEVVIDGKFAGRSLRGEDLAYLSDELPLGTHSITIRSKNLFNIESVVLWD